MEYVNFRNLKKIGLVTCSIFMGLTTTSLAENSDFKLQVLHASDHESAFLDPATLEPKILNYSRVIEGLRKLAPQGHSIYVTAGDHSLPGPFYEAAKEVSNLGQKGTADIAFFNAMKLTANGIGNHEFDGGINDFAWMLSKANYPFISVNLDFGKVKLKDGTPEIQIGEDAQNINENPGKIVRSAYVDVGGEKVGLIGRAPADFFNVLKKPEINHPGLNFYGGKDAEQQPLVSAVKQVLEQVALLEAKGVNKIVLMDHAQDFTGDPLSAQNLSGIDIIVTAGSTGFLGKKEPHGPFNHLRKGDSPTADYPAVRKDKDGHTVVVVNSDQQYTYVGHLQVTFDSKGHIKEIWKNSGPVATDIETIKKLEQQIGSQIAVPEAVDKVYASLLETDIVKDMFTVVGDTDTFLNGKRADVRSRETNLSRLLTDAFLWAAKEKTDNKHVDAVLMNGGGIRDIIRAPKVTKLGIASAFAFNNRLVFVQTTAEEFLATMENAVSRAPARDGRFPQLAGVYLEYDMSKPGISEARSLNKASRVKTLHLVDKNGSHRVLVENFKFIGNPDETIVIATNSFLAGGGDGYKSLESASKRNGVKKTQLRERKIVTDYIQNVLKGKVKIKDPLSNPRVVPVQ